MLLNLEYMNTCKEVSKAEYSFNFIMGKLFVDVNQHKLNPGLNQFVTFEKKKLKNNS